MRPAIILLELLSSLCLLLCGCSAGLANRATAEDYTAAVAAEAAAVSLADGGSSPVAPVNKVPRAQGKACKGTGKVRSGDGLITFDCLNGDPPASVQLAAAEPSGANCACGDSCTCAAELVALRKYRDQAEAFFRARGYRTTTANTTEKSPPISDPKRAAVSYGSCANGQCSLRPLVRRGLFGRR
jgi:hypothetical protein